MQGTVKPNGKSSRSVRGAKRVRRGRCGAPSAALRSSPVYSERSEALHHVREAEADRTSESSGGAGSAGCTSMRTEPIERASAGLPSPTPDGQVGWTRAGRVAGAVRERRAVGAVGRRAGRCRPAPARGNGGGALGAGVARCERRVVGEGLPVRPRTRRPGIRPCGPVHRVTVNNPVSPEAILVPSGDHAGLIEVARHSVFACCRVRHGRPVPSARMVWISAQNSPSPSYDALNTMREPSGDQSGALVETLDTPGGLGDLPQVRAVRANRGNAAVVTGEHDAPIRPPIGRIPGCWRHGERI